MFQGATRHTNNAGEQTALLRAIQGETGATGRTTFMVDSTYAINTATGRTTPSRGKGGANRALAAGASQANYELHTGDSNRKEAT